MKKCESCGEELKESWRLCPACGAPLEASSVTGDCEVGDVGADDSGAGAEPVARTVKRSGAGGYAPQPENLPEGFMVDGRFEVRRKLGQGGFGVVYLAWDNKYGVEKALKILPLHMAEDPEAVLDLKEETAILIRLNHPSVMRVFEFHEDGSQKYIDMEYVPGRSLAKVKLEAPGRRLSGENVVRYGVEICRILEYVHGRRFIHRDIKPHNIHLLPDGSVKVMDFGIAEVIRTSASRAGRSSSSGTELYMSPEQLRGRDVGPESDIYSLGATLYELLSGKPPFYKGNIPYQIETQPPVRIKGASDRLNDILMKCLRKDYHDRYRSAVELQTDLESCFSAEKSGVVPVAVGALGTWNLLNYRL